MASSKHLSFDDIEAVSKLAKEAGELAMAMREGVDISHKANLDDKVTGADKALSILITAFLKDRFPQDFVISEEDQQAQNLQEDKKAQENRINNSTDPGKRVWLVDPIDGTQNYIIGDGQYCIMIGLLVGGNPVFGWVYEPHKNMLYFGGPGYGAFKRTDGGICRAIEIPLAFKQSGRARLLMGSRDRNAHSWVSELKSVELIKTGSIGLKVARILDGDADLFAHLSCKLKTWDTAGPAAIALGAGLEVGGLNEDNIHFPLPEVLHQSSIIMGLPGSLAWCRKHLVAPVLNNKKDS